MLAEDWVKRFEERLSSNEAAQRAITLRSLTSEATGDPRLIPLIEKLLQDRSPCITSLPPIVGEVRWLAARALASERGTQGSNETVVLEQVAKPISTNALNRLEDEYDIDAPGGIEGLLLSFAQLQKMGKLPLEDIVIQPKTFIEMLRAEQEFRKARDQQTQ
ncbi:hypothetical protein [Gloeobacter kilaueensis]|uniref:Uncharacterized protein n=1 Tax=Gloeobacter kilaueensis (strain ATCC BAA-2537 / CCAP 1431/1 / ULC 316 / JS1) TaxID=1183438 RepID=U5QBY1_GLOK1|nr:hypothetical protein [Gloeobacter kilaueensis]AGY56351.1 hypothetical protein GKIL_0104 [Gloeobacter kilaueensis JS1]